ncbi:membrane-bound lytic murein transglycosylase F [Methylohalomonas lacus]|uniref:Membrane-bound lytic murein transglycosylase F n=1 Tax=Methylohalomonas lacus TaxID=398773 RepID=A0AAE3L400_9GAMM|nr:membrane-bound lytic murein transglycosylase MltF [Methylohalomonas lacus]MCS3903083.1 membrane-bound lytic murein transglycosylase F [Methylohalomonas lacus]
MDLMGRSFILLAILLLGSHGCSREPAEQPDRLEHIRETGVLQVITRSSPTTYYTDANGPAGMEYELARQFADELGVELQMIVARGAGDIEPILQNGRADLAAAGLAATELRRQKLRFGPTYLEIRQQLVYRPGTRKPDSLAELDGRLGVVTGSALEERLQQLQTEHAELQWTSYRNKSQQELLEMVANGELDYTVANANEIAHARRYYADVAVAFDLSEALEVAWALAADDDPSLYEAVQHFFEAQRASGQLAELRERYQGTIREFDYVDTRTFLQRIAERLPRYRADFRAAADAEGFDWRLLAAVAYQESHWDPDALSPTGVRGMMMLTRTTAERVGVDDRTDAQQSIHGGARYLREVVGKFPERIPEPDRLWLALAAYNIGFGHLEDARRLTEARGGDPDRWADVRDHLPLLSQKKWYTQTRYGYARGREPVQFVRNVRGYYAVLTWLDDQRNNSLRPLAPPQIISPVL